MKGILLPRHYLKSPLVKVIVRKIAYKSLITTKNVRFLRMDHRNVVHENFFRGLGDIICIKNLFKPIMTTPEQFGHVQAKILTSVGGGLGVFAFHDVPSRRFAPRFVYF